MSLPGVPPPVPTELLRVEDRLSFIYLERSVIHRDDNAITSTDDSGTVHIPAAGLGCLMLVLEPGSPMRRCPFWGIPEPV